MKGLSIGKLDKRFTFQERTETVTDFNTSKVTWSNISVNPAVWGRFGKDNGGEVNISDQPTTVQRATVFIRYRTDINSKMRITCDGEVYAIVSLREPPDFRKQLIELRLELIPEAEV